MGKMLDAYMAEYNEAIKPGLAMGHGYAVKPEIWIYFKWEEANGLGPWDQAKLRATLRETILQDPELGEVLILGMGDVFGIGADLDA